MILRITPATVVQPSRHWRRLALAATATCLLFAQAAGAAGADTPKRAPVPLRITGSLVQGGLVTGKTAPGAIVTLDGRSLRVDDTGTFIAGLAIDAKPSARLHVKLPSGAEITRALTIRARKFRVQRINNLPQGMVTPPPEAKPRIEAERSRLSALWGVDTPEPMFKSGFTWPARGPVSGVYGSRRILNGIPMQVHWGLDIAAPAGAPVSSPADGSVLLAEPDFYYTGGTILVDHGFGLISAFLHLSKIEVAVGQRVKQGDVIGRVGATGRATGPHLDWRMRWFDVFVDPQLLIEPRHVPAKKTKKK